MRACVVGPGRIGATIARRLTADGVRVIATYARDAAAAAATLASDGVVFEADGRRAADGADVIVVSVPWPLIDDAWASIGGSAGDAVVVDTTNPFGDDGLVALGETSASYNARRFGAASYVKAFNTLTSGFQASMSQRPPADRAAMFYVASTTRAIATVEPMIRAVGFVPVFLGGPADSAPIEAPRRPGALYGEEFSPARAQAIADALRRGEPIPAP